MTPTSMKCIDIDGPGDDDSDRSERCIRRCATYKMNGLDEERRDATLELGVVDC